MAWWVVYAEGDGGQDHLGAVDGEKGVEGPDFRAGNGVDEEGRQEGEGGPTARELSAMKP